MVIKLYISGISGNKEVKKKQQRVQMILDSKQINYEAIDITEPGKEKDKEFMQQNGKVRESLGKYPLPPQIFNDDDFCGDYDDFDMANEVDELEKFLHIETSPKDLENGSKLNEETQILSEKPFKSNLYDPYDYHTFKIKWNRINGLQEQIIETINAGGESKQIEDVDKSEVNGESEAISATEPYSENIGHTKLETFTEEVPEKEVEKEIVDQISEVQNEENIIDNEKNEAEAQNDEKKEDDEIFSNEPKEENLEVPNTGKVDEEQSPQSEKDDLEDNVHNESETEEKEEEEKEDDSPQSEKSQED